MGTPKALLDYHGETFVARLVRVLAGACDGVTVVLGYGAEQIRPQVPNRARVVANPDPARGQLSSLQTALVELPEDASGFCFIPVDCPAVGEETVTLLAPAVRGRKESRRGTCAAGLPRAKCYAAAASPPSNYRQQW